MGSPSQSPFNLASTSPSSPLLTTPAVYTEILPSEEKRAELEREIGDVSDPSNPAKRLAHNVFLLSGNKCVKWGLQVHEREAMAMEFVRRNTTISVPKVHWYFKNEDSGRGFLVMDYVPDATSLQRAERRLSPAQREGIAGQIHDFVQQLRSLGGTGCTTSMGSWDPDRPCQPTAYNNVFYHGLDDLKPTTPFTSMEELRQHWFKRWSKRPILGPQPHISVDDVPPTVVLSHGDMEPHNLLVKDGTIVAVVDWDSFGWYPSFWEYAMCRRGAMYSDLQKVLEEVFEPISRPEQILFNFINVAFSTHRDEYW